MQQITADTFLRPHALPFVFAGIGGCMATGSFLNSRIVERLGTRRVSHTALLGVIACVGLHFAIAITGHETLVSFGVLQALTMFCFSLCGPNFGAMAMENVGNVAGAAASLQGFFTTFGGALAGFAIGQFLRRQHRADDGGLRRLRRQRRLAIVLVTERGRPVHAHSTAAAGRPP